MIKIRTWRPKCSQTVFRYAEMGASCYASVPGGQLLLDLAAAGMLREDAYRLVQGHAMAAWESDGDFRSIITSEPTVTQYLDVHKLAQAFSAERQLGNVNAIFDRVFGGS